MKLTLLSPAKLNLFLRVYGKDSKNYHQLASLMQTVSLFDQLEMELSEQDQLSCSEAAIPTDRSNLILRAAELFRQKTGLSCGLRCHLEKQIPHEAGLGGGSANAATALWGLNELTGRPASEAELREWAAELGSDISFFFSSGSAYCTGRGEKLEQLNPLPTQQYWLLKPPFGLSTAKVYQDYHPESASPRNAEQALQKSLEGEISLFNDLEEPAFRLAPELRAIKESLESQGAKQVLMTGSGTALFCDLKSKPALPEQFFCQEVHFVQRKPGEWY